MGLRQIGQSATCGPHSEHVWWPQPNAMSRGLERQTGHIRGSETLVSTAGGDVTDAVIVESTVGSSLGREGTLR